MNSTRLPPPKLRGHFYSTQLWQRCPDFCSCPRCFQCTKYNRHSIQCQACESIKPGMKHQCTPEQQLSVIQLEKIMNKPLFDPNPKATNVSTELIDMSFNDEAVKIAKGLKG